MCPPLPQVQAMVVYPNCNTLSCFLFWLKTKAKFSIIYFITNFCACQCTTRTNRSPYSKKIYCIFPARAKMRQKTMRGKRKGSTEHGVKSDKISQNHSPPNQHPPSSHHTTCKRMSSRTSEMGVPAGERVSVPFAEKCKTRFSPSLCREFASPYSKKAVAGRKNPATSWVEQTKESSPSVT